MTLPEGRPEVGATYQYTSFEEPNSVVCNTDPTTTGLPGQNACGNAAMTTIADTCTEPPCAIANEAGVTGTGVATEDAGYTTAFTSR